MIRVGPPPIADITLLAFLGFNCTKKASGSRTLEILLPVAFRADYEDNGRVRVYKKTVHGLECPLIRQQLVYSPSAHFFDNTMTTTPATRTATFTADAVLFDMVRPFSSPPFAVLIFLH